VYYIIYIIGEPDSYSVSFLILYNLGFTVKATRLLLQTCALN